MRDSGPEDVRFVEAAGELIRAASREHRIVPRDPAFLREKIEHARAALALEGDALVGFGYWSDWEGGRFVSHSGLVVDDAHRGRGLGRRLKERLLESARRALPGASLMSITVSPAVKTLNLALGYRPVPLEALTRDPAFWAGCAPCPELDAARAAGKLCCCEGFLLAPEERQAC